MNLKALLIPILFLLRESGSIDFSKTEWSNPSRPGSSVWLRNGKKTPMRIDAAYVRTDGFRTGDEVALKLGRGRFFYTAEKGSAGQWTRLKPVKGSKKIRVRAGDSLFATGFEYGTRLRAKKPDKVLEEEYVLDLKLVDDTGDSAIVTISESAPKYIIEGAPDGKGAWN